MSRFGTRADTGATAPLPTVLANSEPHATRHQTGLTTLAKTSRNDGSAVIASFNDRELDHRPGIDQGFHADRLSNRCRAGSAPSLE